MGSCPEHDEGEDENGNRIRSKHGTDSITISENYYHEFNGWKLCVERDPLSRTYYSLMNDSSY